MNICTRRQFTNILLTVKYVIPCLLTEITQDVRPEISNDNDPRFHAAAWGLLSYAFVYDKA